jgi:hypothetical protein
MLQLASPQNFAFKTTTTRLAVGIHVAQHFAVIVSASQRTRLSQNHSRHVCGLAGAMVQRNWHRLRSTAPSIVTRF